MPESHSLESAIYGGWYPVNVWLDDAGSLHKPIHPACLLSRWKKKYFFAISSAGSYTYDLYPSCRRVFLLPHKSKPLTPAAAADNKPSSSSSQPMAPSLDAKYAPTKPTCISVNVISVTTMPSAPSAISTTAPVLAAGIATVGHAFKNPTLQDHSPTSTKPSEMTAPTVPKLAASTTLTVSTQEMNNTHSSIIDSLLQIGHDRANRPLPPIPALDWIVPYESKIHVKSVEERIIPTIIAAELERKKYVEHAIMKGYTMNIAIGIQLLVGALTTAISALVTGTRDAISITIVLPILVFIILPARGYIERLQQHSSPEPEDRTKPERSLMVARDLEQFIRECKAFLVDFGSSTEDVHKREVQRLRNRFEEILGDADVEKK
ncbi:hypothetical protein EV421DRAFT_1946385 [Armillaria borealis]|uniref:SMODS and SLOG-associating 2TM effector domain-containing protein n=1 Tax=Armillaria borealis TaxID=47425 RepID=A0AA39IUG9_9AGAR|nr:hypothetical protein EV421DRAFT_1946385 [Armillaria borealis]